MSTRLPLLADCLINISFHADDLVHTATFDADGGTGTEGLLTLTNDDGASTVVLNTSNTLARLVAAVKAVRGFDCAPTPGLLSSLVSTNTGLAARIVSDMAATEVPRHGLKAMVFTNDYEVMTASQATALISSVAIPVGNAPLVGLSLSVDGADAGAAGNATFKFVNNPLGARNALPGIFPATAYEAAFDTEGLFDTEPSLTINGTTEVTKTFQEQTYGAHHIKLASVTNGDNAVLNVKGTIKKVM